SKLAVEMLERSTVYKDSINLEIDRLAVTRELVKQDYEHRISESKLKSENEKAALKITQLKRTFAVVIISALFIFCVIFYFRSKTKKDKAIRAAMLDEIMRLKNSSNQVVAATAVFELVREKIEHSIKRKLNETDWKVLNVLLVEPVMTNKEIAQKVFLSADGVGSSLRRMYEYFNIKESKYKKVSLLLETIKRSNS
ncbi:MAG: AsnC family protein, partial [Polaribacter sp.]|uniref:AsnC family protein n=1 Tax=Polaribacter sp. TaxID=1920175 RepID=UPI002602CBAE